MDDLTRFTKSIGEDAKKYADGHTEHTDDCMSPWSEARRKIMTPETIAANHQLHMSDVEVASIPDSAFVWRLPKPLEDRIAELKAEGKTPEEAKDILKREGLI